MCNKTEMIEVSGDEMMRVGKENIRRISEYEKIKKEEGKRKEEEIKTYEEIFKKLIEIGCEGEELQPIKNILSIIAG